MSWISGFSPDFQDAYERRFKFKVEGKKVFDEWVKEFDKWTNTATREKWYYVDKIDHKEPTKQQLKSLAFEAKLEGIQNISVQDTVRDKRSTSGERTVYRDVLNGRFAKNPYKEEKK